MTTRMLVTGDREWGKGKHADEDYDMLTYALDGIAEAWGVTDLVEGCARGADRMAEQWALNYTEVPITIHHYPAEWGKYPKAAGPIRNSKMLKGEHCTTVDTGDHVDAPPDIVVAFHRNLNQSKGTGDMVRKARSAGVPVFTFPNAEL